ncbi:MAG: cation-translocating P-type ATPase [Saprospiraceae bacterium]|nr:cation-translocating P-type ATPase [Saprospiraceae bacterium]MDW8229176.1 cation-translocating P-type ATPase [Saprospiraceae bacterium]
MTTLEKTTPLNELHGLTDAEIASSRAQYGTNTLQWHQRRQLVHLIGETLREPIFLLLLLACALYFILGDHTEGWLMAAAIVFVVVIEVAQEYRSERALEALRQYTQPLVRVRRGGRELLVRSEELVVGDIVLFSEGERLPADAVVVQHNDLTVDESLLTGESLPVTKSAQAHENRLYQGTVVATGMGVGRVEAVGNATEFGRLGRAIETIKPEPTPLQRQLERFVRQMLYAGLAAFVLVFAINLFYTQQLAAALLYSLSLAMAILPSEIPVAFASFMALGAYRMSRRSILVKQPKTVESLGSATVICLDKTGTITENRMTVAEVLDYSGRGKCLEYAMWASEPEPFDAMEKAIHEAYARQTPEDRRLHFRLFREYPLGGTPPMMTHVFASVLGDDYLIIAAKGAVERVLRVCRSVDDSTRRAVLEKTQQLAERGYRILGVASADCDPNMLPEHQDDFDWQFEGLVALHDPPKPNIREVFERFYAAGVQVKMITGDHPATALNIAERSGLRHDGATLTGEEVMNMTTESLRQCVGRTSVFARMFPEAKLRIVEALKANGEVVAMTGDGVNDAPALKAAQIGIAMGHRGTETARAAASMVLLDDDLSRMVTAIEMGRRIYANLRKAIRYVISIHVPIVLTVVLPLMFGWPYLYMLAPVHVIFMELLMDPTCAVAYENDPGDPDLLEQPPRRNQTSLFSFGEVVFSLIQGLAITAGIFALYHYAIAQGAVEAKTRAFVFTTLMLANIFLTLVNRSFEHSIVRTLRYPNRTLWLVLIIAATILAAVLFVPPIRVLFQLDALALSELGLCALTAFVSVFWVEVGKRWA